MRKSYGLTLGLLFGLFCSPSANAQGAGAPSAEGGLPERIAALKQSLAQSQKSIRTYQWTETTTFSLKGEIKSTTQKSCHYGADGVLQKVPISATPPPEKKGGLRGRIIEAKTEELSDTVKQAVALVKTYVPPDPALIQRSKNAGKASMEVLQPGKVIRLAFRDYQLPGDMLALTVDISTNRLSGINVTTYLAEPSDPVGLAVQMAALADGTMYAANTQLTLSSEQVAVTITNAGYRPLQ